MVMVMTKVVWEVRSEDWGSENQGPFYQLMERSS